MTQKSNLDKQNQYEEKQEKASRLSVHIYILPNLMTTGNLFFGFFSILSAANGDYRMAAYAIVIGAVFDLLDGRLARLTRSTSKFGAEYDSLCDLVTFGMAPAVLLYFWALAPLGRVGWLAAFFYVACAALRLARFNVQVNVVEKAYFQGLPTPMAAGIVASSILFFQDLELDAEGNMGLLALTGLLAVVMVSNFRYRSFKDLDLKERLPFWYLVAAVAAISVIAYWPEVMLFVLFLTYALLGAIFGVLKLGKHPRLIRPNVYRPRRDRREKDLVLEKDNKDASN